MTSRKPPKLAAALLRHLTADDGSLVGDLEEGFKSGKTSLWYWSQVLGIVLTNCIQTHTCAISLVLAAVVVSAGSTVGWWQTRFAVPVLLGMAITSWKLWRLHRTSLVILYVASVALVSPYWLSADTRSMTAANQVFWTITRILGGYGVVGVLLVPFLILRLGRSGPLSDPPLHISVTR
jgi:hypothetical protein